ncbi:MAG: HlyD family efflux transporter periplasmic adaptor subunit [Ruminococcus sp.]|jgi:biotin carboxyl carrier protein|nr:HlyD family efflux transporter periplasmic adaptor subunit [Ruminococcus sp.]
MEQERNNKRKDRIKNAAIIFLIVMLVLTLFSNTIMNISLPQVAVVMPGYAQISEQIRGSGAIEAAATADIKTSDATTVGAILVVVGDTVTEGQTLFTLKDAKKENIEELEVAYENLKNEYDKMLLGTGKDYSLDELAIEKLVDQLTKLRAELIKIPEFDAAYEAATKAKEAAEENQKKLEREKTEIDGIVTDLSAGNYDFLDPTYVKQIEAIQAEIDSFKDKKVLSDERLAELEKGLSDNGGADVVSARQALDAAIQAVTDKQNQITEKRLSAENSDGTVSDSYGDELLTLMNELAELQAKQRVAESNLNDASSKLAVSNGYKNRITTEQAFRNNLQRQVDAATKKLSDLRLKINRELRNKSKDIGDNIEKAKDAVADATAAETKAKEAVPGTVTEVTEKITGLEYDIETARITLAEKQEADIASAGQSAVDVKAKKDAVDRAKAKLDEAQNAKPDNELKSTMSGIITSISAVSGQSAAAGDTLCTVALVENGYQLKFSVSNDQARRVTVGTTAEVMYYWQGDASAKLAKITNDPSDPNNKKLLTFTVTGDVSLGNNLQLTVGERSADYSSVVPASAIHEDSDGKFVLGCVPKSTPFGSRYTAERIPVTVVATNGQYSAIDGSIEGGIWIITTATKPVANNQQVRLQNS